MQTRIWKNELRTDHQDILLYQFHSLESGDEHIYVNALDN